MALWVSNQDETRLSGVLPGGVTLSTGTILTPNAWNHLALTRAGGQYLVYVNGRPA